MITADVAIVRWTQALRVLKELTPHERRKHFKMHTWGTRNDCGTAACLGGFCSLDPWFRRHGLVGKWEGPTLYFPRIPPWVFFQDELNGEVILSETETRYGEVVQRVKQHIVLLKQLAAERKTKTTKAAA